MEKAIDLRISVIIPHYKDWERLMLLLRQFEGQSLDFNQWEVIVVNNDPNLPLALPNDLSVSYRLRLMEEPRPGSYAARNRGISKALGDIIAFTDSDCLPDRNWLKNSLELFSLDFKREIGILTGPVPLFFKNPQALSDAEVYEKYTGFTTEVYAKQGHAITANWFSYKSVLEESGCFNEQLKSNGDSELSGKISPRYPIIYSQHIIVRHPARYFTSDLVKKYRRIFGGTFARKFRSTPSEFRWFFLDFFLKRYRFAFKKLFTVPPKESFAILRVCHAINLGAMKEYFHLTNGGETKR